LFKHRANVGRHEHTFTREEFIDEPTHHPIRSRDIVVVLGGFSTRGQVNTQEPVPRMPLSHVHVIPLQLIVVLLASDLVLYNDEDAVLSVSQEDIDILVLSSYLDVFEVDGIKLDC